MNEENNCNCDQLEDFHEQISNLMADSPLPDYEIGFAMIWRGVKFLMSNAPSDLIGMETALTGLDYGLKLHRHGAKDE